MQKYFLTTHFAQSFVRECAQLNYRDLPTQLFRHYSIFLSSNDPKIKARSLFVAIAYLEDCRDFIEALPQRHELRTRFEILEARLVDLYEKSSRFEGGQLRMLA